MEHELVIFPNGSASVRPKGSGEPMHSSIGAREEAQSLYVKQSGLQDKLMSAESGPLILYDIGMGIAANALAAIRCTQMLSEDETTRRRKLHIISFENDLDGLRLAVKNSEHFPFFSGFEESLSAILEKGRWENPELGISWELREGDFTSQSLSGPAPEIIYYDFYSPKSSGAALWGYESFKKLFAACEERRADRLLTALYTYSSSTAARAAMLLAGFHVGVGLATESKRETTVAATRITDLTSPLGDRWLKKFLRSSKPLPADWPESRREEGLRRVSECLQFRATSGYASQHEGD